MHSKLVCERVRVCARLCVRVWLHICMCLCAHRCCLECQWDVSNGSALNVLIGTKSSREQNLITHKSCY